MIVETAFHSLPEVLLGRPYARQEYESGIVAAFSLALLQELNGRNVPNPISCLRAEKLYRDTPFLGPDGKERYLRADLHIRLDRVWASSAALSRYGWRHSNWLEAKFLRKPRAGSVPKTPNAGALLGDLVRLVGLVPIERPKKAPVPSPSDDGTVTHSDLFTGRYLLHVYEGDHTELVAIKRNKTKTAKAGEREWLKKLLLPGSRELTFADCSIRDEAKGGTFTNAIGAAVRNVQLRFDVTNFVLQEARPRESDVAGYYCVLTRIDSFRIETSDGLWLEASADRTATESTDGAAAKITELIGTGIGVRPDSDLTPPDDEEKDLAEPETDDE